MASSHPSLTHVLKGASTSTLISLMGPEATLGPTSCSVSATHLQINILIFRV